MTIKLKELLESVDFSLNEAAREDAKFKVGDTVGLMRRHHPGDTGTVKKIDSRGNHHVEFHNYKDSDGKPVTAIYNHLGNTKSKFSHDRIVSHDHYKAAVAERDQANAKYDEAKKAAESDAFSPDHREIISGFHKHFPELNLNNVSHESSTNVHGESHHYYSAGLPIEGPTKHLFKSLHAVVHISKDGDGHHYGSLDYSYDHPGGGSNGYNIANIHHKDGEYHIRKRSGEYSPLNEDLVHPKAKSVKRKDGLTPYDEIQDRLPYIKEEAGMISEVRVEYKHNGSQVLRRVEKGQWKPDRRHIEFSHNGDETHFRIDKGRWKPLPKGHTYLKEDLDINESSDKKLSDEEFHKLYHKNDKDIDVQLASNPHTPQDILHKLSKRNDMWTHQALAKHPNLPDEAIHGLLNMGHTTAAVARNPHIPYKHVNNLIDHPDSFVRAALVNRPDLSKEHLDKLAKDESSVVQRAVYHKIHSPAIEAARKAAEEAEQKKYHKINSFKDEHAKKALGSGAKHLEDYDEPHHGDFGGEERDNGTIRWDDEEGKRLFKQNKANHNKYSAHMNAAHKHIEDGNVKAAHTSLSKAHNLAADYHDFYNDEDQSNLHRKLATHHLQQAKSIKEDFEQLDEISKDTLDSYINKAFDDGANRFNTGSMAKLKGQYDRAENNLKKADKRAKGIAKAVKKLAEGTHYHSIWVKNKDGSGWSHHFDADNKEDAHEERDSLKNSGEKVKVIRVHKDNADWRKHEHRDAAIKLLGEESEELDEISNNTISDYIHSSFKRGNELHDKLKSEENPEERRNISKEISRRNQGIIKAAKKLKRD